MEITHRFGEQIVPLRHPVCGIDCQWAYLDVMEWGHATRILMHRSRGSQAEVHVPLAYGDSGIVQSAAELAFRHHDELNTAPAPPPVVPEPLFTYTPTPEEEDRDGMIAELMVQDPERALDLKLAEEDRRLAGRHDYNRRTTNKNRK